jgi:hypothetical protein
MLRLFYGLLESFCLFALSRYLRVDSVDFLSQHHTSQLFLETYLLCNSSVFLYLLDIILEIAFDCCLLNSKLITHLCLHLGEDCMGLCQRDHVLIKTGLFEGAEDAIGFEDCVIDVKATRFKDLDILFQPEDAQVQSLLELFVTLHHPAKEGAG